MTESRTSGIAEPRSSTGNTDRRERREQRTMRILVSRTDRIGDVLLSTPVLSVLREQAPDCHITALVSAYAAGMVEGHPALDEVLIDAYAGRHKGTAGFLRLVGDLRARRFDVVLVLHPTARLALACRLAGIPLRIGTGYRYYAIFFNRRVYEHRRDARKHEVAYNLSLARALFPQVGGTRTVEAQANGAQAAGNPAGGAAPEIHVPEAARRAVAQRLRQWAVLPDEPLVLLHPGSGGSARRWPAHCFAELAARLSAGGTRVVVTGSADERSLVGRVADAAPEQAIRVAGGLDIKELAALLGRASLCVTNSTGPLHIAAAVGTPAVALFCPIKPCSPVRWGPFGKNQGDHDVLMPNVPPCPKCIETACPYFDCMERIPVDRVYEAVRDRLATRPPEIACLTEDGLRP